MIKTKQELLNHFSDINEKYNNPFMYQTLSNMIDALLEQEPCEDAVDRELVRKEFCNWIMSKKTPNDFLYILGGLPSVTPKFTDTEIQKMQELEQAQLDKAYELGKAEMQPCDDCISRTALLAKIDEERKHLLDLKMDGAEHILVHHARRIIEELPTVIPKESKD